MWFYFFVYLIIFIWPLAVANFALLSARHFSYSFKYFWSLFLVAVKLLENTLILWDLLYLFGQDEINLQPRANLPQLLGNILRILSLIPLCFMKFYDFSWLELVQLLPVASHCFSSTPILGSLLTCMCWSAKTSRGPSEVLCLSLSL